MSVSVCEVRHHVSVFLYGTDFNDEYKYKNVCDYLQKGNLWEILMSRRSGLLLLGLLLNQHFI